MKYLVTLKRMTVDCEIVEFEADSPEEATAKAEKWLETDEPEDYDCLDGTWEATSVEPKSEEPSRTGGGG